MDIREYVTQQCSAEVEHTIPFIGPRFSPALSGAASPQRKGPIVGPRIMAQFNYPASANTAYYNNCSTLQCRL